MYQQQALQHYKKMDAHTSVVDADPYKLISLLMRGALDRMAAAKGHIARQETDKRSAMLNKAVDILDALRNALNHKTDPTLTRNLDSLYEYMSFRLFEANVKNDPAAVDEVAKLLGGIYQAWQQLEGRLPDAGVSLANESPNKD